MRPTFLFKYFTELIKQRGEDIFEYGFVDFNVADFLAWLLINGAITQEEYEEYLDEDLELFQAIEIADKGNYDFCLKVFCRYVCSMMTEDQIIEVMVLASE